MLGKPEVPAATWSSLCVLLRFQGPAMAYCPRANSLKVKIWSLAPTVGSRTLYPEAEENVG